ncbi:HK97 family phage prohead protease [Cryobacterium sp. 5I3]|uniref:HK97 family phage prohead protease n=1 Tax=Cryobacterium sp. 5I3 TaxID=3048592 RepID=UPI002B233DF8|nr:HK97 family phage prohead protease [Cryobacterium sp. 5I3]MEB0200551.1 HK97 family phage prohead protease [Cryobacterium sp. 5I3]
MPPNYESRSFERPVTLRAAPEGASGPGILTGYGAVFNSESRDLGGFVEVIAPGAFGAPDNSGELAVGALNLTLHGRVMARLNHASAQLLGTSDIGTLRMFVDDIGLRYEVDLPDTTYARDLAVLAARGDIRYSSFAFRTNPGGDVWSYNLSDQLVRTVTSVTLVDVAPVADPAYWAATSELARSFDLDAIRASIQTPPPAPAGEWERAAHERGLAISNRIKKGHA